MAPSAEVLLRDKPFGTDVRVSFPGGTLPAPNHKWRRGKVFQVKSTGEHRLSITTFYFPLIVRTFPIADPEADIFTRLSS